MSASHKINQVAADLGRFRLETRQGFTAVLEHIKTLSGKRERLSRDIRILKTLLVEKGVITNEEIKALLDKGEEAFTNVSV